WTNQGIVAEDRNSLKRTHESIMGVQMATILNFGCLWLPIGSIRWDDDSFSGTNLVEDVWVRGMLRRDQFGRAAGLNIEYGPVGDTKVKKVETINLKYDYTNPAVSEPYLPSRIEERFRGKLRRIFTIHSISISPNPLPLTQFALDPLLF